MMPDLFDAPPIAGLAYRDNLIGEEEEAELLERLQAMDLAPFRFQGWTAKRLTQTFGWRYDFDDASFTPAEPLPDWLMPVRGKAAAFARIDPQEFVHVLLARYDPGAGIGWHRDRPVFEQVVGISVGAPAVLRFRKRIETGFQRVSVTVEPRSSYHLAGEARHGWEHSIAPGESLRFSITFRTLSELGRRKAAAA